MRCLVLGIRCSQGFKSRERGEFVAGYALYQFFSPSSLESDRDLATAPIQMILDVGSLPQCPELSLLRTLSFRQS